MALTKFHPNFDIFVKKAHAEMEENRQRLRDKFGTRYDSKVGPYRSLIQMQVVKKKTGAVEAGRELFSLLKANGKFRKPDGTKDTQREAVMRAILSAASLDLLDQKIGK